MTVGWVSAFLVLKFHQHEYSQISDEIRDKAIAYGEANLIPIINGWEWQTFEPEPGVVLRTGLIERENAKGTIIVVPGFSGSIEMMMREIGRFHAAGYRVAAIEYRGQGQSYRPLDDPEKGYVESYQQLGSDVAKFANRIRLREAPLFFYSISMGAHVTMRMAIENQVDVAGYALLVPMIKVNSGAANYDHVAALANLMGRVGLGEMYVMGHGSWPVKGDLEFGHATDCNSNPASAQTQSALFALNEKLRVRGVTYQWLKETVASTKKLQTDSFVAPITPPVKMYTAGDDRLVDSDAAQQFCNSLAQCSFEHFEKSRHCIMREDYALYESILDDAVAHFDALVVPDS